jgi:hypothetical protein
MVNTPPPLPMPPARTNGNGENSGGAGAVNPNPTGQASVPLIPAKLFDLSVANLVEVFRGDGTGPTVKDFFRLFESAAATGRWSKEDMVRILQLKVKGAASTFLSSLLDKYGTGAEYATLKKEITDRFTGKHSQHYHYSNLTNAIQMKNESVEAFADRVRRLGTLTIQPRADAAEQRIVREEAERRMLHAFLHGLTGVTGQVTRHKFPETWEEAVQYAVMVAADERSHPSRETKPVFSTLTSCYNCKRPGHMARDCRAPRQSNGVNGRDTRGDTSTRGRGQGRINYTRGNTRYTSTSRNGGRGISPTRQGDRRPLSDVECYNCREKGHYANRCTKPRANNSENRRGPVA